MRTNLWMGAWAACIVLLGTVSAHAERRPYPPSRAAVVVLSYEDAWWSYAGEYPFLWTLTQQLSAKYSYIDIVHGQDSTPERIAGALANALKKKIPVDLFFSTHSDGDSIYLAPLQKWVNPIDFLRPVIKESDKPYLQLMVNFGCENVSAKMVDGFVQDLGFKAYVGNNDISTGAYAMTIFFEQWMNCSDLSTAVSDTNDYLTDTFTHYDAPKAFYRTMGGPNTYVDQMLGYGENLELCYPGQYRNRYSDY